MTRKQALYWAELIDSFRVFPRLFLAGCLWWTVDVSHELLRWYMSLPKEDRGLEASGFASVVILAVFGFLKLVYQTYTDAGRDWNKVTTSVVATTTSTP